MKLFKETMGVNLYDLGFGNNFLKCKTKSTKQPNKKIDKLDLSKLNNFIY